MPTLPAWTFDADLLDGYADLDPVLLASLRTPADEDALVAAVETQLTTIAAAQNSHSAPVAPLRRRTRTSLAELRAA